MVFEVKLKRYEVWAVVRGPEKRIYERFVYKDGTVEWRPHRPPEDATLEYVEELPD